MSDQPNSPEVAEMVARLLKLAVPLEDVFGPTSAIHQDLRRAANLLARLDAEHDALKAQIEDIKAVADSRIEDRSTAAENAAEALLRLAAGPSEEELALREAAVKWGATDYREWANLDRAATDLLNAARAYARAQEKTDV